MGPMLLVSAMLLSSAARSGPDTPVVAAYVTAIRPGYELLIEGSCGRRILSANDFVSKRRTVKVELDAMVVTQRQVKSKSRNSQSSSQAVTKRTCPWIWERLRADQYVACIKPLTPQAKVEQVVLLSNERARRIKANFGNEHSGGGSSWATGRGAEFPQVIFPEAKLGKSFWRPGHFVVFLAGDHRTILATLGEGFERQVTRQLLVLDGGKQISIFNVYESSFDDKRSVCGLTLRSLGGESLYAGKVPVKSPGFRLEPGSWRKDAHTWVDARQALWKSGYSAEAFLERFLMESEK